MSKPSRLCKSRSYWDWLYLYLGLFQDRIEIARAGFHYAADHSKFGGGYLCAVGLVDKASNASFAVCEWSAFEASGEHDLVLASFCPFIRTELDILKMESMSASRCALVTIGAGSTNSTMSSLYKMLPIKPNDGLVLPEIEIEKLLDGLCRCYEVIRFSIEGHTEESIERFIQREMMHLRALGVSDNASLPALVEFARKHETHGGLIQDSNTSYSLILWKTLAADE